jgi:hypothetical protein
LSKRECDLFVLQRPFAQSLGQDVTAQVERCLQRAAEERFRGGHVARVVAECLDARQGERGETGQHLVDDGRLPYHGRHADL